MKKHAIVLIDISYSMKQHSESMIKGLNKFISSLQNMKGGGSDIYISIMLFCDKRHYLCRAVHVPEAKLFSMNQLPEFGLTFLYDAIGVILDDWYPEKNAEHHLFIITDGADTGSVLTKESEVIMRCEAAVSNGWHITHCGVDFGNLGTGVLKSGGGVDDLENLLGNLCI